MWFNNIHSSILHIILFWLLYYAKCDNKLCFLYDTEYQKIIIYKSSFRSSYLVWYVKLLLIHYWWHSNLFIVYLFRFVVICFQNIINSMGKQTRSGKLGDRKLGCSDVTFIKNESVDVFPPETIQGDKLRLDNTTGDHTKLEADDDLLPGAGKASSVVRCRIDTNDVTDTYSEKASKPYSCFLCYKSFANSSNLSRHKLSHLDKKRFHCSHCSKSFARSDARKEHQLIHTGERPFTCSVCSKGFRRSCDLKLHELSHVSVDKRPHKCSLCLKRFVSACNLKAHLNCHTGEKPYCCSMCSRKFGYVSHLKTHLLIHTGDKPYCCSVCDKRFRHKCALRKHTLDHQK